MITQFIRRKNQKVGVLVAEKMNDNVYIGVSKVALTKGDKFDSGLGINIAYGRLEQSAYEKRGLSIPQSVKEDVERFRVRCKKYYKQEPVN